MIREDEFSTEFWIEQKMMWESVEPRQLISYFHEIFGEFDPSGDEMFLEHDIRVMFMRMLRRLVKLYVAVPYEVNLYVCVCVCMSLCLCVHDLSISCETFEDHLRI